MSGSNVIYNSDYSADNNSEFSNTKTKNPLKLAFQNLKLLNFTNHSNSITRSSVRMTFSSSSSSSNSSNNNRPYSNNHWNNRMDIPTTTNLATTTSQPLQKHPLPLPQHWTTAIVRSIAPSQDNNKNNNDDDDETNNNLKQPPQPPRMYYWNVQTGETSWVHPKVRIDNHTHDVNHVKDDGINDSVGHYSVGNDDDHVTDDMTIYSPQPQQQQQQHKPRSSPLLLLKLSSQHNHNNPIIIDSSSLSPTTTTATTTTINNYTRPDSHTCCAILSFIVFPPLGCCALFHSCMIDQAWDEGRTNDAIHHSRQSYNYAWFGVVVFFVFFVYFTVSEKEFKLFE